MTLQNNSKVSALLEKHKQCLNILNENVGPNRPCLSMSSAEPICSLGTLRPQFFPFKPKHHRFSPPKTRHSSGRECSGRQSSSAHWASEAAEICQKEYVVSYLDLLI